MERKPTYAELIAAGVPPEEVRMILESERARKTGMYLEQLTEKRPFIEHIRDALKDESSAGPMYEELAREARELGYPVEAETLRRIATDERTHWALINEILRKLRG